MQNTASTALLMSVCWWRGLHTRESTRIYIQRGDAREGSSQTKKLDSGRFLSLCVRERRFKKPQSIAPINVYFECFCGLRIHPRVSHLCHTSRRMCVNCDSEHCNQADVDGITFWKQIGVQKNLMHAVRKLDLFYSHVIFIRATHVRNHNMLISCQTKNDI
jgi:hypothetical protein